MNKVLVIDDAAFMRMTIKIMLERSNYEVVGEAGDGKDGIKLYKDLKPDIVTLDITMPDMDGIAALKEIKKFDPNAKVIMVSAMGQELMVRESIKAGANSFLVKPFKEDQLAKALDKVLGI